MTPLRVCEFATARCIRLGCEDIPSPSILSVTYMTDMRGQQWLLDGITVVLVEITPLGKFMCLSPGHSDATSYIVHEADPRGASSST